MEEIIQLAVRDVTTFLLQSGSIDSRLGGPSRAIEGAILHRRFQKAAGPGYQAEVPLALTLTYHSTQYQLEGRADGLYTEDGILSVDEIKTTVLSLEQIDQDYNQAHWGQAYCYAYMVSKLKKIELVGVRLTYIHVDSGEIKQFYQLKTSEELETFIESILALYHKWVLFQSEWGAIRNKSIHSLSFPFPEYRRGQRELAVAVYRTIQQEGKLFSQAPTGIGKTISTLFPSVKAIGEGMGKHIFYLTAKTITRTAAEVAFTRMRNGGLRIKTVTLTAKDKVCFLQERSCNPEDCPYAKGYYDRVRDAVYDLISSQDCFTRLDIEAASKNFRLCPFELSLDLAAWCDCVICDYNYLFDPIASLNRFFADEKAKNIILIDEAHNLVDRAREMYSASLFKSKVLALKNALGKGGGAFRRSIQELNNELVQARKDCGDAGFRSCPKPDETLCQSVSQCAALASAWLEEHRIASDLQKQVLDVFFDLSFFLKIQEQMNDHYCTLTTATAQAGEVEVRLLCLDPSELLAERLTKGQATIFFSATLSPLDYYRQVLGGGLEARCVELASPFPQDNLCLLCAAHISTKFKNRADSFVPIAYLLYQLVNAKQGNYLAYFPSYIYLKNVYDAFCTLYPQVETIVQTNEMDENARERFLLRFHNNPSASLLGFCVLGGIFSEGVDLQGDRLIGTAIIGVGLPQLCPERDLLRSYYNKQNAMGYEFAYQYPGMNKVLQAAGRVIRSETDRGIVLLIDSRYQSQSYHALVPQHWSGFHPVYHEADLLNRLHDFWENSDRRENSAD